MVRSKVEVNFSIMTGCITMVFGETIKKMEKARSIALTINHITKDSGRMICLMDKEKSLTTISNRYTENTTLEICLMCLMRMFGSNIKENSGKTGFKEKEL